MIDEVRIRPFAAADMAAAHALNQANVPAVGDASRDHLEQLVGWSRPALVADGGGELLGFVLAMPPGLAYSSPNYRWFDGRYDDFLYVDRIAVRAEARRRRVASKLYDAVEEAARAGGLARVTCEVNVRPRNESSLRFHDRRGFVAVGEQETYDDTIRVRLLAKPLSA